MRSLLAPAGARECLKGEVKGEGEGKSEGTLRRSNLPAYRRRWESHAAIRCVVAAL